jgi:hypothetical protein
MWNQSAIHGCSHACIPFFTSLSCVGLLTVQRPSALVRRYQRCLLQAEYALHARRCRNHKRRPAVVNFLAVGAGDELVGLVDVPAAALLFSRNT